MSNDEKIDANEEIDIECATCAGEGSWESDEFSHRSGHYNKSHKCQSCDGTGTQTMTRYAVLDRENDRLIAEKARLKRELNTAHARIVELTKQLQASRVGGDGTGAATLAVPADDAHIGFGV